MKSLQFFRGNGSVEGLADGFPNTYEPCFGFIQGPGRKKIGNYVVSFAPFAFITGTSYGLVDVFGGVEKSLDTIGLGNDPGVADVHENAPQVRLFRPVVFQNIYVGNERIDPFARNGCMLGKLPRSALKGVGGSIEAALEFNQGMHGQISARMREARLFETPVRHSISRMVNPESFSWGSVRGLSLITAM